MKCIPQGVKTWVCRHPTATLRIIAGACALVFFNAAFEIVLLYDNVVLSFGLAGLGGLCLLLATSIEIEL